MSSDYIRKCPGGEYKDRSRERRLARSPIFDVVLEASALIRDGNLIFLGYLY